MSKETKCPEGEVKYKLRAAKNNMPFLVSMLTGDAEHLFEAGAKDQFVELSAYFIRAFIWQFSFFVDRNGDFCAQSKHVQSAARIAYLLMENSKVLSASNVGPCFVRRDALWVYGTGLILLFLEEVRRGEVSFEEGYDLSADILRDVVKLLPDIVKLVPEDWVWHIGKAKREIVIKPNLLITGSSPNKFPQQ